MKINDLIFKLEGREKMDFLRRNNIFIMSIICLVLTITINATYSKFTYSKELIGNIVTVKPPTFSESLIESAKNNLDTNVDFGKKSSTTNGIGLMMRDGTQNDEYPIVYYRGDVSNNNVIFADLCWLIVRTTETGGTKLVFNGPVVENADGTESCTNYSGVGGETANTSDTDVLAGNASTKFNTSYDSPVYVGYMYNEQAFTLNRTTIAADWPAYLSLQTIDSETGRHTTNLTDSAIKEVIDAWYKTNIEGTLAESLLEDTVWCNDRSVISETYSIENYSNGTNTEFYFAAQTRLSENTTKTPSLMCIRDIDKFTVDSVNGNGDLDYPIGLLTADEINLAGHPDRNSKFSSASITTYLRLTSKALWTLSPSGAGGYTKAYFLNSDDYLSTNVVWNAYSARPAISLNKNATISGGNGSFITPYLIEVK